MHPVESCRQAHLHLAILREGIALRKIQRGTDAFPGQQGTNITHIRLGTLDQSPLIQGCGAIEAEHIGVEYPFERSAPDKETKWSVTFIAHDGGQP